MIAATAADLPADATIDGEAVVCDDAGVADFERLQAASMIARRSSEPSICSSSTARTCERSRSRSAKGALRRLLRRVKAGIHFNEHFDGDGAETFAHACRLGLEGIVSKDRTRPYRSGPSETWLKIKNPDAPGVRRFEEEPT